MEKWIIRYWIESARKSPVEEWLDELTEEQFIAVSKELKVLELVGYKLRLPHSRALGKGLFELRERRYGYRVYYGFRSNYVIIVLTAGDKTSQKRDIKIARERLSKTEGEGK
jgi:putative addiction module killer protein